MVLCLVLLLGAAAAQDPTPLGRSYWENYAKEELQNSLNMKLNTNVAKNVIIFVGDGMGPNTVTAARIYKKGETGFLAWERFPHSGALKTYAEDKTVTDSAASGTSLFCGVKTNYNVLGLSADVKKDDCAAAQQESAKLRHITSDAQAAGKSTGIVTTSRVTHATPGALFAWSANRDWECGVPPEASLCKDIGRQMVEDLPGRDINVILGGGLGPLQTNVSMENEKDEPCCSRKDGRDLIKYWEDDKAKRGVGYKFVNNSQSLQSVDTSSTDYLLGIFAPSHMKYHYERDTTPAGSPTLEFMTTTALKILMKNKNGFFLMVEAEHVDLAHHKGRARKALNEVVALHDAVSATMTMLEEAGVADETLVIVTSDHSHTLTISGYPKRGNSILGIAQASVADGVPYTTLGYANGAAGYHYVVNGTKVSREDPSKVNTSSWDYGHQAAVLMDKNSHGGHDVLVYAKGPYSHLFHHMHEQNYVAHVARYAARIGEYSITPSTTSESSSATSSPALVALIIPFLMFLLRQNN